MYIFALLHVQVIVHLVGYISNITTAQAYTLYNVHHSTCAKIYQSFSEYLQLLIDILIVVEYQALMVVY